MKQKLIAKAQELRQHGFTTGEIADELNVSMDTARWLTLQKAEEKTSNVVVTKEKTQKRIKMQTKKIDFFIK